MSDPESYRKPTEEEKEAYLKMLQLLDDAMAAAIVQTGASPNIILTVLIQYTIGILDIAEISTEKYTRMLDTLRKHAKGESQFPTKEDTSTLN